MTYNQLIKEIDAILGSHGMIKTVKNVSPTEWLKRDSDPPLPVCCFDITSGSLATGRQQVYTVQFFFLDKAGQEHEFETDVISDQWQVSEDIIQMFKSTRRDYYIDDLITINKISDKYEDYLAGVSMVINFNTQREFDACATP